ncbi:NAD(P)/FAD-dependent oxidoreductase [Polynucleobacter sp. AP-Sanab-80-C2]|jgi:NADH dehydrogenase FAD-containing subunit|uniref:NAD(P)/FAD-dependent oxidoreductase n=1 Tax=unclassified Polynucleobacter TaxID=2640945 RepID=UPI001BFE6C61|nr:MULTISPECIES: NAD(P)/FAD-dependent oxidoreductase [unclassified Polynucleobacter]MEA9599016.1 NAD(P)/FAD-dependent oxidoreductase [Polynucleobacter sp. AP-Sanab-80-C2]QWD71063.1 FAD-dependent oxidoreductase [Polynucleobacter sp. UB-Siik-W21]
MDRRHFIGHSAATLGLLAGFSGQARANLQKAEILVIGGGYGGATAAKYLRLFSNNTAKVTLIEPNASFVSCPLSNLVIGGSRKLAELTSPYDNLSKRHGIKIIQDSVASIDPDKKTVKLASGKTLPYDKVIVSPGVSLMMNSIEGLAQANKAGVTLQAWKAGAETVALHKQLASMRDGGTYALSIPEAPYRCPPGPYERACQVASYFKQNKPKSKVLILDANQDVTSKGALFKKVWAEQYAGMIEYLPKHNVTAVDAKTKTIKFEIQDDLKADVLNLLPAMSAGDIAVKTGLANSNGRWVNVNFINFESTAQKDIHVLGDSIQVAFAMPKSGHMANQHAKVAAAAIVAELSGWEMNPAPVLTNTCYSFVNAKEVVHVASVHQYITAEKTFKPVPGSGGVSPGPTTLEGVYAWGWAHNIWADTLG